MTIEKQTLKLPDALKVAQHAESCQKSVKVPKSCRASCGQGPGGNFNRQVTGGCHFDV